MILWLASFPKSGNTWLRLLISNYFYPDEKVFDNLNLIKEFPKKTFFENFKNEIDFNQEKINLYKYFIKSQERLNLNNELNFLKTHSCCGTIGNNKFTDEKNTLAFIYIIRDPRSVAISYAYHSNQSFNDSVKAITNDNSVAIDEDKLITYRSSWKMNYYSWIKSPYPRLILKYEDLKKNEFENFKKILKFISQYKEIEINDDKIKQTIEKCNFQKLKIEEKQNGFIERWGNENFFRKGQIDEWKQNLSNDLIKKIENNFKELMNDFGYL